MAACETCKDWGRTIDNPLEVTVACPKCKRRTWPNTGVNCPAGAAVALGAGGVRPLLTPTEMYNLIHAKKYAVAL